MVFESVVVDVLNRFLGDYVVNLDTSQLSLGIWAGNETAAVPPSRLPCFRWQSRPCLPGASGPTLPPAADSFGVMLRRAGRQLLGLHWRVSVLAGGDWGLWCWMKRPPLAFRRRDPQWTPRVWSSNSTEPPFSAPRGPVSAVLGEGRPRDTPGLGLVLVIFAPWVVMEARAAHGGPHAAPHVKARSCDRRCRPPPAPSLRVRPNLAGCSAPHSGLTASSPGGSPGFGW